MKYLVNVMIFDRNGYQKEKNIRFNNLLQLQKKVEDLDLYCVNYISGATNKDKEIVDYIDTLGWERNRGLYSINYWV